MSLSTRSKKIPTRQLIIFALLGVIMFISKIVMEALPNIHLLGMLTVTYTLVYRWRALIPIYVYVFLNGLFAGFDAWWIPYIYIWTILWAATMLLPRKMPKAVACAVYPILCGLHGLLYGILYAPAQAIMFNMNFQQMLTWISMGAPFDLLHAIGNVIAGLLIYPMSEILRKLESKYS